LATSENLEYMEVQKFANKSMKQHIPSSWVCCAYAKRLNFPKNS